MNPKQTLHTFLTNHQACAAGYAWAMENCNSLEETWATAKQDWLVWLATRPGVLTNKELRYFSIYCCQHILLEKVSRDPRDQQQLAYAFPEESRILTIATDLAQGRGTIEHLQSEVEKVRKMRTIATNIHSLFAITSVSETYAFDAAKTSYYHLKYLGRKCNKHVTTWLLANVKPNFPTS